jgi:hypothetical protein
VNNFHLLTVHCVPYYVTIAPDVDIFPLLGVAPLLLRHSSVHRMILRGSLKGIRRVVGSSASTECDYQRSKKDGPDQCFDPPG